MYPIHYIFLYTRDVSGEPSPDHVIISHERIQSAIPRCFCPLEGNHTVFTGCRRSGGESAVRTDWKESASAFGHVSADETPRKTSDEQTEKKNERQQLRDVSRISTSRRPPDLPADQRAASRWAQHSHHYSGVKIYSVPLSISPITWYIQSIKVVLTIPIISVINLKYPHPVFLFLSLPSCRTMEGDQRPKNQCEALLPIFVD